MTKPFDAKAWAKQVTDELGKHRQFQQNHKPDKRRTWGDWLADALTAVGVATLLAMFALAWWSDEGCSLFNSCI
jgi:hypothetical protein